MGDEARRSRWRLLLLVGGAPIVAVALWGAGIVVAVLNEPDCGDGGASYATFRCDRTFRHASDPRYTTAAAQTMADSGARRLP